MNKNDQQFMAQKIRTQYMEKEASELDALRQLDKKVKRPVNIFSYVFGSLSAIIMGTGMSLVMTDLGKIFGMQGNSSIAIGVSAGVLGMILAGAAYPTYGKVLKKEREKAAPEILRISEELIK